MAYEPFGGALGGLTWGMLAPYGSLNLTVKSPPQSFDEPLTLGEVKDYLKLPQRSPADPDEDATILAFMTAAREVAEILQGRDLVLKQWDLLFDYFFKYQYPLREPLVKVDLLQYTDSAGVSTPLVEGVDFLVDKNKHPGIITPMYNRTWPVFTALPSSAVLIRFTSGVAPNDTFWSDAGTRVKIGMKLLISEWYNNRLAYSNASKAIQEYPMNVTALLSFGSLLRVG